MPPRVIVLAAGVLLLLGSSARAQTPAVDESPLATAAGHDVTAGVASYTYREPGDQAISISGAKVVLGYTGTFALDRRRHWFASADVRGTVGNVTYDGWCSPFVIVRNSASPNGYELDLGDGSPCGESGDRDWYIDARALAGKDVIGDRWAWSPYSGAGLRHLSNGTSGAPGYRIDDYLYLPLGVTARTTLGTGRVVSAGVEVDVLLHGWQKTHDSSLGGGDVPATATTPPFTIDGFSDISFSQSRGWALRAGASVPVSRRVSLDPYYLRWSISASPASEETATFTVNNVTAREQLGAYEPYNTTNEFGIAIGFRFD